MICMSGMEVFIWNSMPHLTPNDFCIRWKYLHQIHNVCCIRCNTFFFFFIKKPGTQWFWYHVKIITPDTQCFCCQVWSFLLLLIMKPDTQWFWFQLKIITPDTHFFGIRFHLMNNATLIYIAIWMGPIVGLFYL